LQLAGKTGKEAGKKRWRKNICSKRSRTKKIYHPKAVEKKKCMKH
jgi:hypothetical protein